MNKKLIAGILFAVVAGASFWACGEGTVSKWNSDDDGLKFLVSEDAEAEALKKEGLDSCLKDDYCKSKYAEYFANPNGDTPDDIPSSNDNGNSGTNPGQSSSSIGNHNPFDIVDGTSSSSAARIDDNPQGGDQSSSSVKEITGLGMCEPAVTPIERVNLLRGSLLLTQMAGTHLSILLRLLMSGTLVPEQLLQLTILPLHLLRLLTQILVRPLLR